MLFANERAVEVAGEGEVQIFKFRVMSLVREVFCRVMTRSLFPPEEMESRYCKSNRPCGFSPEGKHSGETAR